MLTDLMCCDGASISQEREVTMNGPQVTLASTGFEKNTKTTRRAQFLAEMERVVPWRALCAVVDPLKSRGLPGRQ